MSLDWSHTCRNTMVVTMTWYSPFPILLVFLYCLFLCVLIPLCYVTLSLSDLVFLVLSCPWIFSYLKLWYSYYFLRGIQLLMVRGLFLIVKVSQCIIIAFVIHSHHGMHPVYFNSLIGITNALSKTESRLWLKVQYIFIWVLILSEWLQ